MKYLLFSMSIITICFATTTHAQVTTQAVTGNWICKHATTPLPDPGDSQMKEATEMLKKGFVGAQFTFRPDGIFNFVLPQDATALMTELKFLDNQRWFVHEKQNMISIGTPDQNLMQIKVRQEGSFLLFSLLETPLILKMERQ